MKKEKKNLVTLTALAGLLVINQANAQQNNDTAKIQPLNEVVVTATRAEKNLNDIGRSISVITSEDIKTSGANNISELLNQQEGIYIVGAQQNPGSFNSIYTRGSNSNQTVIMIDGVRMTDPSSTDNSIDLSELSMANIDRVEIVRGSHSTIYGSSAIGGVINIITKGKNQNPGVHVDATLSGGAFNPGGSLLSENLLLNYTHKSGFYVNAEALNTKSKGFNSTVDTVTNAKTFKHPDMSDGFNKLDLIGKLGFRNDKLDVYASYKKVQQKSDIDAGAFQDDENYTVNFNRNLITYGASYKLNSKFSLKFNGGMSDLIRKAINDSSQIDATGLTDKSYFKGVYSGTLGNNELQANFSVKGMQLVFGGGLYKETMSAETYYFSSLYGPYESKSNLDTLKINATTANGFIHADLNGELINDKFKAFSLGLGGRYVKHSLFGNAFTYEINPSIKLQENTLLYFSYSTGFNAPALYQLYSPEKDYTSGITRGNKTLKPEESRSWEVGIKQKMNDNIWWSICYFNTVVKNVVDYVYLWDKNKNVDSLGYADFRGDTYINLGKQTNRGVEFSLTSKISNKFLVSGNFSLLSGKLEYAPENIDSTHSHNNHIQIFANGAFVSKDVENIGLVRRPSTGNITLTYLPIKKLALKVNARCVGARNDIYYNSSIGPFGALGTVGVEDYTLLDFSVRYEIIKGFSAMVRIENILDTKYYEIKGYATRGRGFYGGLRYSF